MKSSPNLFCRFLNRSLSASLLGAKTLLWWYWLLAQEEVQSNGEEVCGSDDRSLLVGEAWGLEKLVMECEKHSWYLYFPNYSQSAIPSQLPVWHLTWKPILKNHLVGLHLVLAPKNLFSNKPALPARYICCFLKIIFINTKKKQLQ